jgi:hypothetical protein
VAVLYGIPREVGPPKTLGLGVDWEIYPVELADFIEANPPLSEATVFNTNEISGYLEYRFGESLPLYMDGRCLLYPERFYEEYLLLATADSTRALEQLRVVQDRDIGLALVDWQDPGTSAAWILSRMPGWTPVFWDDLTIAYARREMLDSMDLSHLAMDHVDPLDSGALLSWPLYRMPPSWIPELERAAGSPMNLGLAGVLLSAAHLTSGDRAGAEAVASGIQDTGLRASLATVLDGETPAGEVPVQLEVIRIWSLVRSGRSGVALGSVRRTGDPVLEEALEIWTAYSSGEPPPPGAGGALPFLPGMLVGTEGDSTFDSAAGTLVLASAAMTTGQLDSAVVLVEGLLDRGDSLNPWMLASASLVLASAGDDIRAITLADRALSLSASPFTIEARGRIDWMQGRYRSAVGFFRWLLDISPGYTVGRCFYADCLWRLGEVDASLEQYRMIDASGEGLPPEASGRIDAMEMLLLEDQF